jgi:hypothetical protein
MPISGLCRAACVPEHGAHSRRGMGAVWRSTWGVTRSARSGRHVFDAVVTWTGTMRSTASRLSRAPRLLTNSNPPCPGPFDEPVAKHVDAILPDRGGPFLAALAHASDVSAGAELDVTAGQCDQPGNAQSREASARGLPSRTGCTTFRFGTGGSSATAHVKSIDKVAGVLSRRALIGMMPGRLARKSVRERLRQTPLIRLQDRVMCISPPANLRGQGWGPFH